MVVVDRLEEKRLEVDGKFFRKGEQRFFLKMVTYGPFPDPHPDHAVEMRRVAGAGFNALRVYERPSVDLLNAAHSSGLFVFVGLHWQWDRVFLGCGAQHVFEEAKGVAKCELGHWANHPAVAGCFVANELRPDLVRWMGVSSVRSALEELIEYVGSVAPWLLVAYSSFPSSEYLEPENADFTAVNVYLENHEEFAAYLKRLHHLAGDRPVVVSEFGVDSADLSEEKQAEVLQWSLHEAQAAGLAGWTCFGWSDRWSRAGVELLSWDFGLLRRDGSAKPALEVVRRDWQPDFPMPMVSVIICVYNGAERIAAACESLRDLNYPNYEVIVVDDGSTDETLEVLAEYDHIQVVHGAHAGLSVARNLGAQYAKGEILSYTDDDCEVDRDYLFWLAKSYHDEGWDACGGPNIPPVPTGEDEAVVASAPGAPSHVMLTDVEAEHIPGCHLSVRKSAFDVIEGFRAQYRAAGDDVDFCWRLKEAGFKIGFSGASFVWHRRRTSLMRYFMQQKGYGKAEALLMLDHPEKFTRGNGARWEGCVYTGAAAGAQDGCVIYSGPAGMAGYQLFWNHMMPSRPLHALYNAPLEKAKLWLAQVLHPFLRKYTRWWYSRAWAKFVPVGPKLVKAPKVVKLRNVEQCLTMRSEPYRYALIQLLVTLGWVMSGDYEDWDLEKDGMRLLLADECLGQSFWRVRARLSAVNPLERELDAISSYADSL